MRKSKAPAQTLGAVRHGDQVNMVSHQAVPPDFDPKPAGALRKHVQVKSAIIVAEKDLGAQIVTMGNMVRTPWNNNACLSNHSFRQQGSYE